MFYKLWNTGSWVFCANNFLSSIPISYIVHISWQNKIMRVFASRKSKFVSHELFSSHWKQNLSIDAANQELILHKFQVIISSHIATLKGS